MSRFDVAETPLDGVLEITRKPLGDARGSLTRLFCAEAFAAWGFDRPVAQINHTVTQMAGAVRGMHFQHAPHSEDKLVICIRGAVFDVAVDVRSGSATQLRWHGVVLSAENRRALFIPRGFAHGFQTLTENCELIYLHSHPYVASAEAGLRPTDPRLAIDWPQPITQLSERDGNHPFVEDGFSGVYS